jgi:hypothetical protein
LEVRLRSTILRLSVARLSVAASAVVLALGAGVGCGSPNRRPERVPVPPVRERDWEDEKPLPGRSQGADIPPPPFYDEPLVNQRPPEQRAFVEAYEAVGRPRILVFVNRTLEGEILPVNPEDPLATVERRRTVRGNVNVETRDVRTRDRYYDYRGGRDDRERLDRFESRGPGEYTETTEVYLRPGEYDEVAARAMDYEAMENILTDWLAADGRVEVVSPVMARQRLTDQQVKELQEGRPRVMGEIARELDADILVQVQARPTRQTRRGLAVRVVTEAINVRNGGQSIARAVVEVPPPLDKPQLNRYTRFLGRRLMDGMANSWQALAEAGERDLDRDRPRDRDRGPERAPDVRDRQAPPPPPADARDAQEQDAKPEPQ